MLYKEDWNEAKKHFTAWWNGSSIGRPALGFTVPRDKPLPAPAVPEEPADPREYRLNVEFLTAMRDAFFAEHRPCGELFPRYDLNLGPGSLAIYLGSEPGFSRHTVWYEPCIDPDDPESTPLPEFDPDNPWWTLHCDMIARAAEHGRGKALTTIPDLVENIDIFSAMRDPKAALLDLYDRPEWVKAWIRRIDALYFEYFDRLYDIVKDEEGGNAFTAFQVWAPGRMAKVQCDFSYMISPDMFAEFVVPTMTEQCDRLDYSVYHLDGPGAIPHVQHLVQIPGLNAIQWTPGAGNPPCGSSQWYDLYHQVREGGKSLLLLAVAPDAAADIVRELGSADGLYIGLKEELESEAAAEDYMKAACEWV